MNMVIFFQIGMGENRVVFFGAKQYKRWLATVGTDGFPKFSSTPIYGYRGKEDEFYTSLINIAGDALYYSDKDIESLSKMRTFGEVAGFFSANPCKTTDFDQAILFLRRALAHVLAYGEQEGQCVVATCHTIDVGDTLVDTIEDSIIPMPNTQFTWYVTCVPRDESAPPTVRMVEFNSAMAHDPTLWYKRIVSRLTNPVSIEYVERAPEPSSLNIAAPFLHAAAYANMEQTDLDRLAEDAWEDNDVQTVLGHVTEMMAPPAGANEETRELFTDDGRHLLYTLAWCIQNCRRSTQIIGLLTPVQQCGKTTFLPLLQALLGYKIITAMSVEQLDSQFLDILRGRLFVFLDEGMEALIKFKTALKRITGCGTLATQAKNQQWREYTNAITALFTANDLTYRITAGSERDQPHFPTGHRQQDKTYFDRLYSLFGDQLVMQRAFLVISRLKLTTSAGSEFRPNEPSVLCAQYLREMADPSRCKVYENMAKVLGECKDGRMSAVDFEANLTRVVAREGYQGPRAEGLALSITTDLVQRNIIRSYPERTTLVVHNAIPANGYPEHWVFIYARIVAAGSMLGTAATALLEGQFGSTAEDAHGTIAAMTAAQYLKSTTEPAYITTCLRIRSGVSFSEPALKKRRVC